MTDPTPPAHAHPQPEIGLDHVGLIVPDLEAARALWSDLGFTLTARADHTRTGPDGTRVPAGSSQHSVMLEEGYIELMQITDPKAGHPLTAAMQQRYGLHILALSTGDPQATHQALTAQGCTLSPVMDWSRPIAEGAVQGLARFRFFDTPWWPSDASYVCWVQHLTPDLVRPPATLRHAHGARALRGLRYEGAGAACLQWLARLRALGVAPPAAGGAPERSVSVALGPGAWLQVQPDTSASSVQPRAITLAFDDLAAWTARVRACGLQPLPVEGGVAVDLGPRCPIRIEAISEG